MLGIRIPVVWRKESISLRISFRKLIPRVEANQILLNPQDYYFENSANPWKHLLVLAMQNEIFHVSLYRKNVGNQIYIYIYLTMTLCPLAVLGHLSQGDYIQYRLLCLS